MRPGITLLAILKVYIKGGNFKDTPLTVLKSERQHGRKEQILYFSKFESVLLLCDMYTSGDLYNTCVKETITKLNYICDL